MWTRRSHTLAPLTKSTSINRKFKWTKSQKYAFEKIKRIVARDTLLTYPGFNETFKIHTDASTFRLGLVKGKKDKHIAFYIIKLADSQQRYTVTQK